MIDRVLANVTVGDIALAEEWYTRILGRAPDARPMPGLLEWYFSNACGLQVWEEPERAGKSAAVLGDTDLPAVGVRLTAAGVAHPGLEPGGGGRILQLSDPDGNRVVFVGE